MLLYYLNSAIRSEQMKLLGAKERHIYEDMIFLLPFTIPFIASIDITCQSLAISIFFDTLSKAKNPDLICDWSNPSSCDVMNCVSEAKLIALSMYASLCALSSN